MTNNKQQTTNNKQQTTNNKQQTTELCHMLSSCQGVGIRKNDGYCINNSVEGLQGIRELQGKCCNSVETLGFIDKGTGKHQSNLVYSIYGLSPCICAALGVKMPGIFIVVKYEKQKKQNR